MKLLYLSAHSILEYDQLRLWSSLGIDVFSLGAYLDPANPGDDKRPAVTEAADHPELRAIVDAAGGGWAAKDRLPSDLIDWADTILVDAFPERWIGGNWPRIKHKRVIWRTIGQSSEGTETVMGNARAQGVEIVRYSPAERRYFEPLGVFAGEDALIRFAKDPADWHGWTGEDAVVGNITQNMADRGDFCGLGFWLAATEGLPVRPAGPGSEKLPGGVGALGYDEMREYLRRCRAYLYTGTVPASYTLGLMEAMLTGTPVVSIGPGAWNEGVGADLFEGHEFGIYANAPARARESLQSLLDIGDIEYSDRQRQRAIDLFGVDTIAPQWAAFLGVRVAVPA